MGSDYNENHEKNEFNHAQAGIEEEPVHEGEVPGNLKSKVNSSTAEECCSQNEVETLNNKGTMEDHLDDVEDNVEMVDAELGTTRTEAEAHINKSLKCLESYREKCLGQGEIRDNQANATKQRSS